ncbi:hypothetical protein LGN43_28120 [Burkholderia multivorans]|nr:hypothetical protein [Burkholderia multivorans]
MVDWIDCAIRRHGVRDVTLEAAAGQECGFGIASPYNGAFAAGAMAHAHRHSSRGKVVDAVPSRETARYVGNGAGTADENDNDTNHVSIDRPLCRTLYVDSLRIGAS